MSDEPTITAIAPWFGSKRTLAPRIVAELGEHRAYWEPFCGSMAVLMAKPPATVDTVNDFHLDLVNYARTIQHPVHGPWLYRQARRILMSEAQHTESLTEMCRPFNPTPDRALHYFITSWQSRNGVAGTERTSQTFARRYTSKGGQGAKRFQSAVSSIPEWRRRLRNVNVLNIDAFELLNNIEDARGTVIYCDPPYIEKGASYVHDFTDDDHRRLADALSRFERTRVVVSYYDHPLLADLYPGWTVVHCPTTKAMVNQGRRDSGGAVKAPEVLLINGPSYTQPQDAGLFAEAHP